jgi:LysR family transcriptional regulator, transcriptional activator of the cysJI operon
MDNVGKSEVDLSHLSTFCTVVEAGSISRAAKELFVTQPAISLKIQELEDYYQVQLLDRTNKGITPTEIGLYLYGEAQKVIAMLASIEREIELTRNPIEDLNVGASCTIGNSALPCTLLIFQKKFPGYSISIEIGNTQDVFEKLISRRIEIGLVEGPIDKAWRKNLSDEQITVKKITQTRLILVSAENGTYHDVNRVNLEELKKMPLILREQGSGIRATFEHTIIAQKFQLSDFNIIYEMNTSNSIVSAVASDMGVALLPVMALRKELRHKILKAITVKDIQFKHDFHLIYRENSKKKSHQEFVNLVSSKERGFC